jgi:hypothetical protein
MLLSGVARLTQHAGQSRLLLTLSYAAGDWIMKRIATIRAGLDPVLATEPQLPTVDRWRALVRHIVSKNLATRPQNPAPISLSAPPSALRSGKKGILDEPNLHRCMDVFTPSPARRHPTREIPKIDL